MLSLLAGKVLYHQAHLISQEKKVVKVNPLFGQRSYPLLLRGALSLFRLLLCPHFLVLLLLLQYFSSDWRWCGAKTHHHRGHPILTFLETWIHTVDMPERKKGRTHMASLMIKEGWGGLLTDERAKCVLLGNPAKTVPTDLRNDISRRLSKACCCSASGAAKTREKYSMGTHRDATFVLKSKGT